MRQNALNEQYWNLTLFSAAQQHDSLGAFSGVMLGFVVPITVVTLVVSVSRPAAPQA